MKNKHITIIDDDTDVLKLLRHNLEKERATTYTFTSGMEGLDFIEKNRPDAIICEWMLDDIDGIDICKTIKKNALLDQIPFIMLTGRSEEIDAVIAFEHGADEFIRKPVRIRELISRIAKIFKQRSRFQTPAAPPSALESPLRSNNHSRTGLRFKDLALDINGYKAYLNNRELKLTLSEFKLLQLFMHKPGKVYTRNQIIEKINGIDYVVTERSIDVQIAGLRKKFGPSKDYLETVRGVGYRLANR